MEPKRSLVGAKSSANTVEVDGVRLAYDEEGEGPPLLCVHAIGHGARDYEGVRASLKDRYRVLALDWPGQGRSGEDRRRLGTARYAELVAGFVERLAIPEVAILGCSIGGGAAIRYASAAPEKVRALVLVNSAGLGAVDPTARLVTAAMARFFAAGARGASWYPRLFDFYYRLVLPLAPARAQRERIAAASVEIAPLLAEAWRSFGRPDADTRALATALRCPVFVAWAKSDRFNPLWHNRATIRRIPNVRFETYPGGHAPFLECPEKFMPSLEVFLADAWRDRGESRAPRRHASG